MHASLPLIKTLAAQRHALTALEVDDENVYIDYGLTGAHRPRPGLREAMAAVRGGDTLVVTGLHRLACSLPDARGIARELLRKGVSLSLGGHVHDPADHFGRGLFDLLGVVAGFETDLLRMRTREGMTIAKAKGRLQGKQPKLSAPQRRYLLQLHDAGEHTQAEIADLFNVSRTTIYRELLRRNAAIEEKKR